MVVDDMFNLRDLHYVRKVFRRLSTLPLTVTIPHTSRLSVVGSTERFYIGFLLRRPTLPDGGRLRTYNTVVTNCVWVESGVLLIPLCSVQC